MSDLIECHLRYVLEAARQAHLAVLMAYAAGATHDQVTLVLGVAEVMASGDDAARGAQR